MMGRRSALALLFSGVASLGLVGCGSIKRIRYKMTVEVETPDGLKSGSAVREVSFSTPSSLPSIGEGRPHWRLKGEAVAVELSGGRTLFALLTSAGNDGDYAKRIPADQMDWLTESGLRRGAVELWPNVPLKPRHGSASIPSYLPMLVTFRDIADPKSVEEVDPNNLEAHFGAGVRLKRIAVQTTNDAVTKAIESKLGWLGEYPEPRLDHEYRGSANPNLSQKLSHGAFRQGAKS